MRPIRRIPVLAVVVSTTALMALGLHPGRAMADEPGCQVGPADSRQAWAQGPQTINVDVNLNSDPAVLAAIQQAFASWQNSSAGKASQITFNVRQLDLGAAPTGQYLIDESVLDPGRAAETTPVPPPLASRASATTTLNLGTGLDDDPVAVERIMAHEIGHTFGLPDAYTNTLTGLPCPPGTSVMGPLDPSDLADFPAGPTTDDSSGAVSGDGYATPPGDGGDGGPPADGGSDGGNGDTGQDGDGGCSTTSPDNIDPNCTGSS